MKITTTFLLMVTVMLLSFGCETSDSGNDNGAEIEGLDFTSPSALETINGWVNTKTHGKIPEILKEITPNRVMFLLNAIYFKGIWSKEFNKQSTIIKYQ
jgi:serine protease inhibitor